MNETIGWMNEWIKLEFETNNYWPYWCNKKDYVA